MEAFEQKVILFSDKRGREHFTEWLHELTDVERSVVLDRLGRVRNGNFGDIKPIKGKGTGGLFELRFRLLQGLRVFYGRDGNKIVVLLNGSDKGDQESAIKLAIKLWNEYKSSKE